MYRYLIEAIQVCTIQIYNLIFCSLFGASFMLIACSEVKILKKKNECYLHGYGAMFSNNSMENLDNHTFTSKNYNLGHE